MHQTQWSPERPLPTPQYLEGKPRTPLSSRVATRVSWSPLSGLKGVRLLPGPLRWFLCPERRVAPRVLAACTAALPPNWGHLWGKPVEQRETAGTPRSQPTGPLFLGLQESLPRCWPHNSRDRGHPWARSGRRKRKTTQKRPPQRPLFRSSLQSTCGQLPLRELGHESSRCV